MKNFIILLALTISPQEDSISVMFWNLENFFDCKDEGGSDSEKEFSPHGERHWSRRRFGSKCSSFAKTVFWIADYFGRMPEIIGLAEVENRYVVRRILEDTGLRKYDYGIVHFDSPDPRGIDVALLYDKRRLKLSASRPCRIDSFETRDILETEFLTSGGDSIAVLVVHLPSQYGGKGSSLKRARSVETLMSVSDSLACSGWQSQVVIGDFNDVPEAPEFSALSKTFVNMTATLSSMGEGSIRFNGRWELIDQCHVSYDLSESSRVKVCHVPFLTVKDNTYGGEKPLRTYSGPRYLGGVSDHCPIIADIIL